MNQMNQNEPKCDIVKDSQKIANRARVHFVLRGKNAGNFELVSLISKSHATVVSVPGGHMGVLYFAQVCTTFVVYSVPNSKSNARKNG